SRTPSGSPPTLDRKAGEQGTERQRRESFGQECSWVTSQCWARPGMWQRRVYVLCPTPHRESAPRRRMQSFIECAALRGEERVGRSVSARQTGVERAHEPGRGGRFVRPSVDNNTGRATRQQRAPELA